MSTETSCHFGHLLQVSKKISLKSDLIHLFIPNFIHVYSPAAGADNPLRTKFVVNWNILSLRSFVASFKKISLKSDLIQFFHDFIHVYSPGAGAVSSRGQNFDLNKNVLSFHSFVASFKIMPNFLHFFHDLIHLYSPGAQF